MIWSGYVCLLPYLCFIHTCAFSDIRIKCSDFPVSLDKMKRSGHRLTVRRGNVPPFCWRSCRPKRKFPKAANWSLSASRSWLSKCCCSSYAVQCPTLQWLTVLAYAGLFRCFHSPPNSDMDHRIFSMHVGLFFMCMYTGDLRL